jgi:hypothetical protein
MVERDYCGDVVQANFNCQSWTHGGWIRLSVQGLVQRKAVRAERGAEYSNSREVFEYEYLHLRRPPV